MKYKLSTTKKFEKAVKRCLSRGFDMTKLRMAMQLLIDTGSLPSEYHPHKLKGFKGNYTWECHLEPDWLLVWEQHDDELLLIMLSTGTHSDLFKK